MCGIAGFVQNGVSSVSAASFVKDFSTSLRHRGPDNTGYCLWNRESSFLVGESADALAEKCQNFDVGLMHRRLSIIDTSELGHQPMTSKDGRYVIVQNGEIYNFIELRTELESLGYEFVSQSDTEVLLYSLIEWGQRAFRKLNGMFAFCFVDRTEGSVILARDFYGIKPLFYSQTGVGIVFSSEIKAIQVFPGIKNQPNLYSLRDYLSMGLVNHNERSFFEGIKSVLPGHCLKISIDKPNEFEQISFLEPKQSRLTTRDIGFDEAALMLKEHFIRSVELHMRSDVPYGALLSGGVDSSAIVAAMRMIGGEKLDLRTFTYAARGEVCNEEGFADLLINSVGANATKVLLSSNEVPDNFDNLMSFQDEPIGSTSIFAQYRVFEAAHDSGLKVVLDGQGADEILAGYTPYYTAALAGFVRKGQLNKAFKLISYLKRNGRLSLANLLLRTLARLAPNVVGQMVHRRHVEQGVNSAVKWEWFDKQGILPNYSTTGGLASSLDKALELDFTSLNLPGLLRYEDRNSMAHSLESRVPFLSNDLVSFIQTLPEDYLISPSGEDKALFRKAMRGLVPDEILDRKDKIGFQTPEQNWFGELKVWGDEKLASEAFQALPFIDTKAARNCWDSMGKSGKGFPREIWRWICVSQWAETQNIQFS